MRPDDALNELREELGLLKPGPLIYAWRAFERGGLPSGSFGGRKGSEPPLPLPDAVDRRLVLDRKAYTDWLNEALELVQKAVRLQNSWLIPVASVVPDPTCRKEGCRKGVEFRPDGRPFDQCAAHRKAEQRERQREAS